LIDELVEEVYDLVQQRDLDGLQVDEGGEPRVTQMPKMNWEGRVSSGTMAGNTPTVIPRLQSRRPPSRCPRRTGDRLSQNDSKKGTATGAKVIRIPMAQPSSNR
jgi:hypothetical protein